MGMGSGFRLNSSEKGLSAFFKDYQIQAFEIIWENPKGSRSKDVWVGVNNKRSEPISRASIINFLEDMRINGVLDSEQITGKGGKFYLYSMPMGESGFKHYLASHFTEALMNNYSEETKNVIERLT